MTMGEFYPPGPPPGPPYAGPPYPPVPPRAPRRSSMGLVIGIAAAALAIGLAAGLGIGALVFRSPDSHTRTSAPTRDVRTTAAAPTTAVDEPIADELPDPSDFEIEVIVTEQTCFGSAGCIYHYDIDPSFVGDEIPSDDAEFTVVYEIHGGDEPQTGNVRVSGGEMRWDQDNSIDGPEGATLTAVPVRVF